MESLIADTITLGLAAGTIGNLAKNLSNYLLYRAGVVTQTYPRLAASVFTDPGSVKRPLGTVIGLLTDGVVGAAAGIPLAFILTRTGKDSYLLKGVGVGLAAWLVFYGGIGGGDLVPLRPEDPPTVLASFGNNVLYGAVAAYAATRLGDPRLFRR